jgi:hypothetical protein
VSSNKECASISAPGWSLRSTVGKRGDRRERNMKILIPSNGASILPGGEIAPVRLLALLA